MKKENFMPRVLAASLIVSLLGCISGITYAWFSQSNNVSLDTIYKGTSSGAYFAYGNGTKESPFGINEPRHLYNLAWLQYLGQFNTDTDGDGKIDSQYYFELADDVDMNGLVLPPIGTEDTPFIGSFDGKGYTVSNLTISNSISSDGITNYPYIVEESSFNSDMPEVIGFFGVVGYLPADEEKYSLSSVADSEGNTTPVNQVHDLYLDDITVKNSSSRLLAGFLAGYVNGSITDCGVHYCSFDIASNTTNIADLSTSVSKYSYVGAINADKYKVDGDTSGGGQENDWGGSIDFASFDKRISFAIGSKENTKNTIYSNSGMNTYVTSNANNYYWNNASTTVRNAGLLENSYLPLNVDETKISTDDNGTVSYDLQPDGSEPILKTNTGYVTGAGSGFGSSSPRVSHVLAAKATTTRSRLGNSVAEFPTTDALFDSSNYSFLYYDSSGGKTYRLQDDNNKENISSFSSSSSISDTKKVGTDITFQKYDSVKSNFLKALKAGTTTEQIGNGQINLHGLLFFPSSTTLTAFNASNVQLSGKTFDTYQLYQGGINFSLNKTGWVTLIVGAYTNANTLYKDAYDSFFSLYHVDRSDDEKTIESANEIKTIYKNGETYEYNPSSTSGKSMVFDFSSLNDGQHLLCTSLFYFEFPLNKGNYFLNSKDKNSPYVLYLDIGANASDETGEDDKDILTIDFVWAESDSSSVISLIKITDTAYVKSEVFLAIETSSSTTAKRSYFYYKRVAPTDSGTTSSFSHVYYFGDYGGLTIENTGVSDNAVLQTSKDAVKNA